MDDPGLPSPPRGLPCLQASKGLICITVAEIPKVISLLTQSPATIQQQTIEKYFTRNASFTHPFCRTGSFDQSRLLILYIYRWYRILSPQIELQVNSVGQSRLIPLPECCT